mmetsp:Transcript_5430/g.14424  ORF Transcript_5430/g.14424 Transcript_5430/m.14424 type:complete len:213 (+) Transcript_5430:3-641(+)
MSPPQRKSIVSTRQPAPARPVLSMGDLSTQAQHHSTSLQQPRARRFIRAHSTQRRDDAHRPTRERKKANSKTAQNRCLRTPVHEQGSLLSVVVGGSCPFRIRRKSALPRAGAATIRSCGFSRACHACGSARTENIEMRGTSSRPGPNAPGGWVRTLRELLRGGELVEGLEHLGALVQCRHLARALAHRRRRVGIGARGEQRRDDSDCATARR